MNKLNDIHIIQGVITKPIKVRELSENRRVANFSVGVDKSFYRDGTRVERTKFYAVEAWNHMADHVEKILRLGDLVTVKGEMDAQGWLSGNDSMPLKEREIKTVLIIKLWEFDLVRRSRKNAQDSGGIRDAVPEDTLDVFDVS